MAYHEYLSYLGAALSLGVAAFVLVWSSRSFAYVVLCLGMAVLGIELVVFGYTVQMLSPGGVLFFSWIRSVIASLLPGIWLVFSLSFGRINYREHVKRWRWIVAAVFAISPILSIGFKGNFYTNASVIDPSLGWSISLGWAGYLYQLSFLICSVLVLINMENILRASSGSIQWQVKFMALGLAGIFAVRVYTSSQALLYYCMHTSVETVNAGACVFACVLVMASLMRMRMSDISIYLSQTMLFNSVTVFIVAAYLILVGILAEVLKTFGEGVAFPTEALFIFIALMALAVFLMSQEVRLKAKFWLNRHLKRPTYDYRNVWNNFSQSTLTLLEQKEFCATVTRMVSSTLGTPAVTIWLVDEKGEFASLGGSTLHSMVEERSFQIKDDDFAGFMRSGAEGQLPRVVQRQNGGATREVPAGGDETAEQVRTWFCAPMRAAGNLVGFMTLSERTNGTPFSTEDLDLLKTISDQTANSLLNLRFSERIREAKQLEAFQTISAFFVHDLKNLASTLSLTLKNLPVHYDNPEFRKDALNVISNCVEKINAMCGKLSSLKHKLELDMRKTDVNDLIDNTLANMNGVTKGIVVKNLRAVPAALADPEQIQKILVNLVINACEATGENGRIMVETDSKDGWIELSVSDNGCGIPMEFLEKSLFRPFKTTKKKGLGIGLFQCKRIMEAHGGKIDVESEPGKGSTFRLLLPEGGKEPLRR